MNATPNNSTDNPGVVMRPPFLYAGALAVVFVCRWFWPMLIFDRGATLWPGIALVAIAFAFMLWGRRTLAAAGTNINPARPTTTIVSSGPFRFSRNPLYLGLTLAFLGITLAVDTWWGIVVLVPVAVIMHRGVVLREERYLENKFGDSYRQYRARVRRYL
jgi:protein-S-isoprenylcysteine O-methyltransferase Ste14